MCLEYVLCVWPSAGVGVTVGAKPGGSHPLGLELSRELKTDIIQITTQTNV